MSGCQRLGGYGWLVWMIAGLFSASAQAQVFAPLPGVNLTDPVLSTARGISSNGQVVVGATGLQAARWLPGEVLEVLGVPAGEAEAEALAASLTGQVVTGTGFTGNVGSAFRWAGGFSELGGVNSHACGMSDDGSVIVGYAHDQTGQPRAFRWTAATGIQFLGTARTGAPSFGWGISPDGSVVVGQTNTKQGPRGFFYSSGSGYVILGTLPNDTASQAVAASLQGQLIVGTSSRQVFSGVQGFTSQILRRTTTSFSGTGDLFGGQFQSAARDVSADGGVIVGSGKIDGGLSRAVYWTANNGLLDFQNLLHREFGVDLSGWNLTEATGVSADGLTVVGNGVNPQGRGQGWIARLPSLPLQSAPLITLKLSTTSVTYNSPVTVTLTATRKVFGTTIPVAGQRAIITVHSVLGNQTVGNGTTNANGQFQVTYRPSPALGAGNHLLIGGVVQTDGTSGESTAVLVVKAR